RVCGGSTSPRLRYRITHQKIRPQTNTPTARAATTEPTQMLYIVWAWSETPVGQPNAKKRSAEQPDSSAGVRTASTPSLTNRLARRRPEPLAITSSCLLNSLTQECHR